MAYDPQEELSIMFHRVLSRQYGTHTVAFDIIMFILDNLESLCYDYNILAVFFPNILKVSSISRQYGSHTIAFDITLFNLDNLESLCYDYNILSVFFPNILKVSSIDSMALTQGCL